MLEVLIISALYGIIQKLWTSQLQRQLMLSKNFEESFNLRIKIRRRRLLIFVIMLALFFSYTAWCYKDVSIMNLLASPYGGGIVGGGVMALLYFIAFIRDRPTGNISALTKSLFLKKYGRRYALYLRGFTEDDYSSLSVLENRKKTEGFSEYELVRAVSKTLPVCAVGMTKEVDAPYGAMRVYVNDTTWKSDVRELMEKATHIFILVNSRQSCIWEIEQAGEMLNKTDFIVDDLVKYSEAQTMMSGIKLPNIRFTKDNSIGVVTFKNGDVVVNTVENTERGYSIIAKANLPRRGCLFRIVTGVVRMFVLLRWLLIISLVVIAVRFFLVVLGLIT